MNDNLTHGQIIRNFNIYLLSDIELEEPFQTIFDNIKYMLEKSDRKYLNNSTKDVMLFSDNYSINYISYHKNADWVWLDMNHIIREYNYLSHLGQHTLSNIMLWYIKNIIK